MIISCGGFDGLDYRSPAIDEASHGWTRSASLTTGERMMAATTQLMLTTTPGLEDVTAQEFAERATTTGIDSDALHWPETAVAGRVRVDVAAREDHVRVLALSMRSAHHAMRHVATSPLPHRDALERISRMLHAADWPELDSTTPFRVTSTRHGQQTFSSPELQAHAGAVLQSITGAPVDLENYRVNVQVDAIYGHCVIGVRWTEDPLGLRFQRRFNQRVALKPPVAHALLRLATRAGHEPGSLLDPFCGTGTILLEAGAMLPQARLYGGDIRCSCVEGTRQNLEAAGLGARSTVVHLDARQLADRFPPDSMDLIVSNPPYGRRLGRGMNFSAFYEDVLVGADHVLQAHGRLALLVGKRGAFNKARQRVGGWHVRHARIVNMNRVHAGLLILERR